MGLFSPSACDCGPLPPAPKPLAVWPFHCQHQYTVAFKLRERGLSISHEDWAVREVTSNAPCFRVSGKILSFRKRREFYDTSGNHLCSFYKKWISLRDTYLGESPHGGHELFEIKSHWINLMRTGMTVKFKNTMDGGREEELDIVGSFWDRSAKITYHGHVVAQVGRKFLTLGQIMGERHTYIVTVAPGVDAALMIALCVALDEKEKEED